jgi:uncharacterized membrane protein YfcA
VRSLDAVAWREQLLLIPFMAVGIVLGIVVLSSTTPVILARILGGFVIGYAIYQWWPRSVHAGSRVLGAPFGLLGGLVGAVFGTGGPFYVIYLTLRGLEKTPVRATFAMNFLIDGGIRLVTYASLGFFGLATLTGLALALPVAAVALYLGGRLHLGLSQLVFVRVISMLLLAGGLTLLLKG